VIFKKYLPPHILAFTSDRTVDFTFKDDQHVLNKTQKEFLFSKFNDDLSEPVHIRQVHGNRIIVAEEILRDEHVLKEADGLITQVFDLPLAIRSADCLSVFLYDEKHNGIGLVHVGWKGILSNIAGQAIKLIKKQWQADPEDVKITFGPAIRSCCYEVGGEFQEFFPEDLIARNSRNYLDLPQITSDQLLACGVEKTNIYDCDICTCCDPNYFSFRREGNDAGRMISLIMLKGNS